MAGARWPIAGALGAAATCALLWGCPDANPLVVGTGGTSSTSSSSSSSGTGTTTTSSSTTGTGGTVGCSAANLFAPGVDSSAGMLLSGIATGDMDGDGKPNLVVSAAEAVPPSVVVLLNQGQGTFLPKSYTTVDGPGPLAVADLDGDGKLDVAVSNDGTDVVVLLGGGDGSLGTSANLPVPNRVAGLAAADLNADGKPDLAVANPLGTQSGGVSVLINNGGTAFADPFPYPVPTGCVSVAVADLDGDGKPDLAIACGPAGATDTGHVYVLINTGGGTFATPMEYAIGVNPSAIVAVDLTGDGKPDLAVADSGSGSVDVLINKGTVFAAGGPSPPAPARSPSRPPI